MEVLNRAIRLGFVVVRWLEKLHFCDKFQVKRRFCSQCMKGEVIKIILNTRKNYNFAYLKEKDESYFSWQVSRIVNLKIEKGDFAAQA